MQITEVSERHKVSPDTLRYYERIGLIPRVNRNRRGVREYTEADERWIDFAACMRKAGLSIEVLIEYINLVQQGEETAAVRKSLLVEQRNLLAERFETLKKTLERLDTKIAEYENIILQAERKLNDFHR